MSIKDGGAAREKPILFSTPMVKAILEGRKTMTRRVVMPQPVLDGDKFWQWKDCQWHDGGIGCPQSGIDDYSPYQPGDILWVRETWRCMGFDDEPDDPKMLIQYRDETSRWVSMRSYERFKKFAVCWAGWNPSIHMPREAARLFLEVKSVRIERLQDITEEDADAEGYPEKFCIGCGACAGGDCYDPIRFFKYLWNEIYAKRVDAEKKPVYSWESNPWVWVIEFDRRNKNEPENK